MKTENALLFIALASDVAYPLLSWKLGLPEQFRLVSQAAILILVIIGLFRSLRLRNFPFVWLMLAMWLIFSSIQALTAGQSFGATVLGLYVWLRYPLLGLYAYTRPKRFPEFDRHIYSAVLFLVGLNLLIQVAQFVGGEIPGDNLAGFWGLKGSNNLASFICVALAIAFGNWIIKGPSRGLWILIGMSIISSVLAETKIFLVVIALTGILAILLYSYKRKRILSGVSLSILLLISSVVFIQLYDVIFHPQGAGLSSYLRLDNLIAYLSTSNQNNGTISYIGRWVQFGYTWKLINQTPTTLLIGLGIGSLETSRSLGVSGVTLLTSSLGVFGANTLTALIGDFGLIGIIVMFILFTRIALSLFSIRSDQDQEALNIGLAIFICTLPLWMFYMYIWVTPITMLIFWFGVGQEIKSSRIRVRPLALTHTQVHQSEPFETF
jgi:hypothetical protein